MFYNNYMEYFNAPIVFTLFALEIGCEGTFYKSSKMSSAAIVALLLGVTPEMLKVTIAILPLDLYTGFAAYTLYASLTTSMISC